MTSGCAALAIVLTLCSPAGRPIVAEIFYDAPGADTGHEFVELFNPGAGSVSLLGLRLEAGDGSTSGRRSLRWTGSALEPSPRAADSSSVAPASSRLRTRSRRSIYRRTHAVRIVWPDGSHEVVAPAPSYYPEYFCGEPAEDAASGSSLARRPDDAANGLNVLDFARSAPSPGRPTSRTAISPGSPARSRSSPSSRRPRRWSAWRSSRRIAVARASPPPKRRSWCGGMRTPRRSAGKIPLGALEPGDTARLEIALPLLRAGKQRLIVRLDWGADQSPENDLDSLLVRAGPGPLEPTEIQFHPASGEGEWVEIRNRSTEALDLTAYTLSDRGSARGRLSGGQSPCEPESLALLSQDRDALLRHFSHLDPSRVWQVTPWASLNNTNDAGGIADAVVLRDEDGTRSARVDYSAAGIPAGVPIERREGGDWGPTLDPAGSPLRPNPVPAPLDGRFKVEPRRLRPGNDTARIAWSLPWPRARLAVDLYDLGGARIGPVLLEAAVAGRGEREWKHASLPSGLYLMVLLARAESGTESLTASQVVRVEGRVP